MSAALVLLAGMAAYCVCCALITRWMFAALLRNWADRMEPFYDETFIDGIRYARAIVMGTAHAITDNAHLLSLLSACPQGHEDHACCDCPTAAESRLAALEAGIRGLADRWETNVEQERRDTGMIAVVTIRHLNALRALLGDNEGNPNEKN